MQIAIYAVIVVVGLLGSRAGLIAGRGGIQPTTVVPTILNLLGTFGTIALLIWGFFHFPWYIPIIVFLVGSALSAILISQSTWAAWYRAEPVISAIVIAGGGWLVFAT